MTPAAAFGALGGRTFASLRKYRNYRLYFTSHAVSFIGTWMQQIAAYWLVFELTDSPVAVGALALVQLLPVTLLGLFVGSALDRFDVRRLLFVTESVMALAAAILAVLTLAGVVEVWQVYVLGAITGVAAAFDNPARHALVFRIVGAGDLPNAVALSSSLGTLARLAGPALGGLVVGLWGPGVAFAINATSFLAVIGALLAMRTSELVPQVAAEQQAGVLAGARESLAFMWGIRRTRVVFVTVLVVSTISFNFDVLVPLLAGRTLDAGAGTFGLLASVFGAGALCGALALASLGKARMRVILAGAASFGALELVLAPQTALGAVCALLFALGVCYVLWNSSGLATMQLAAPPHLRGRAAGLYFFAFQGGAPLGGLLAGWLVSRGGTQLAFIVAGTMAVLVAASGAAAVLAGRASAHTRADRLRADGGPGVAANGSSPPTAASATGSHGWRRNHQHTK